ncbi:MAG: hypothetical protein HY719_11540 [Planctomycetes bacterium]|nr:hypothetical protein [Planctomycetota bacterium]
MNAAEEARQFLRKSRANLLCARVIYVLGSEETAYFNVAASRTYYSMYLSAKALAALCLRDHHAGARLKHGSTGGGRTGVLSVLLENQVPSPLVEAMRSTQGLREQADYETMGVEGALVEHAISSAQELLDHVLARANETTDQ